MVSYAVYNVLSHNISPPRDVYGNDDAEVADDPDYNVRHTVIPVGVPVSIITGELDTAPDVGDKVRPSVNAPDAPFAVDADSGPSAADAADPVSRAFTVVVSGNIVNVADGYSAIPYSHSQVDTSPIGAVTDVMVLLVVTVAPPGRTKSEFKLGHVQISDSAGNSLLSQ